jgi:hypothetical protein
VRIRPANEPIMHCMHCILKKENFYSCLLPSLLYNMRLWSRAGSARRRGPRPQIFSAIPFLYELRELLDWSCTATCLTLFDWLKLEDIHTSLFFVTCSRRSRRRHALGERQPRWLKFFQATAPPPVAVTLQPKTLSPVCNPTPIAGL